MSISLRDQLLKAGLVNEKQAKQAGKEKQKQQRLAHKGQIELDDTQQRLAAEAKAEKISWSTRNPTRSTHFSMFRTMSLWQVMRCTLAPIRTPESPMGFLIPSW